MRSLQKIIAIGVLLPLAVGCVSQPTKQQVASPYRSGSSTSAGSTGPGYGDTSGVMGSPGGKSAGTAGPIAAERTGAKPTAEGESTPTRGRSGSLSGVSSAAAAGASSTGAVAGQPAAALQPGLAPADLGPGAGSAPSLTPERSAEVPAGHTAAGTHLATIGNQAERERSEPDLGNLIFDDAHLPMTFANGWVLDRRRDRLDGATRCLLMSAKEPIFDGYDQSTVRMQVSTDALLVTADSSIDTSYPGQGLRVDNGRLVPFKPELPNERSVYTTDPIQRAMATGERLTVALGFWPTWPKTKTQQATFNLSGFDAAYAALKACSRR